MLHLQNENDRLRVENARLRSDLAKVEKENRVLNMHLKTVRESRDRLETQVSELLGEVQKQPRDTNGYPMEPRERFDRAPKQQPVNLIDLAESTNKVETPILPTPIPRKSVQFEQPEVIIPAEKTRPMSPASGYMYPERFEESGTCATSDFTSSWTGAISISKSHPGYVTVKNNDLYHPKSLDDYIFVRTIDGKTVVPPTLLPHGIVIKPMQEFTIYANHPEARQTPGKSCILTGFTSFGCGKVTENRLLDDLGHDAANCVLCEFH